MSGVDQTIHDGGGTLAIGVLEAVSDLRAAVATAPLPAAQRRHADHALDAVEDELDRPEPNPRRVADRLERLVEVLEEAGALAGAAERVNGPLRRLAGWLGAAGAGVLVMLG